MQDYPNRQIKFIVGSPVGGGVDRITRIVADGLSGVLGQPVVVENVTGTSAMIGSAMAAKAVPDGYTLLMVSSQFSVLPCMYPAMPYDTLGDFVPLGQVATAPLILVVPTALEVESIKDFIELSKARTLKYANAGNGGSPHLAAESFKIEAGINIEGVLYEGIMPAIDDLLVAKVDALFASLPSVLDHIRKKRLIALGVTSLNRVPVLPQVPAIAEAGLPGFEYGAWFAAFGPAKLTPEIVNRLAMALRDVLQIRQIITKLQDVGYEPAAMTQVQFASFFKAEMEHWRNVVSAAGIRAI